MNDKCFVDTNVFIYDFLNSNDIESDKKSETSNLLLTELVNARKEIIISPQVLAELSNVLLKKYRIKIKVQCLKLRHYPSFCQRKRSCIAFTFATIANTLHETSHTPGHPGLFAT